MEREQALKRKTARKLAENERPLNLQLAGYTFARSARMRIVEGRSNDIYIYIYMMKNPIDTTRRARSRSPNYMYVHKRCVIYVDGWLQQCSLRYRYFTLYH